MTGVIRSINDDEDQILLDVVALHCGGRPFDLEPTYSIGGLYRGRVPAPHLRFDIAPREGSSAVQADCRSLPLPDASIGAAVFDPPFMFNPHGRAREKNRANLRYTMFDTFEDLVSCYQGGLREFRRVLEPGGILAFKCQDYTDHRTTMTHCLVWQWAQEAGFYAKDLFIRYRLNGPAYNPVLVQRHARKFHSYWFVFEKSRRGC